ncbi:MAG: hypothetical protein ACYDHX_00130 [Methanothrix sp.]
MPRPHKPRVATPTCSAKKILNICGRCFSQLDRNNTSWKCANTPAQTLKRLAEDPDRSIQKTAMGRIG